MKALRWIKPGVSAYLGLSTVVSPALALADEMSGTWEIYEGGGTYKSLKGAIDISRRQDGKYACEFTFDAAHEICTGTRVGNKLNLRSRLAEPVAGEPNYAPDNFLVEMVRS